MTGYQDTESTETEVWVISGISGETSTGLGVLDDVNANAPHAFFYPNDWGSPYEGKPGLYYSKEGGWDGSGPAVESEIYYMERDATGWASDADGFNGASGWAPALLVAVGSTDPDDPDFLASHPWTMLTREGNDHRIQLLAQSQHHGVPGYNEKIVQVVSVASGGEDFGLGCDPGPCGAISTGDGYVAVDADGSSATDYVWHARHSRILWDNEFEGTKGLDDDGGTDQDDGEIVFAELSN